MYFLFLIYIAVKRLEHVSGYINLKNAKKKIERNYHHTTANAKVTLSIEFSKTGLFTN